MAANNDLEQWQRDMEERLAAIEQAVAALHDLVAPKRQRTGPLWEKQRQAWARRLATLISRQFNEPELKELCFEFGVAYEDIRNGTLKITAANLVMRFYRRQTLAELALYCQQERPATNWPLTALDVEEA